MKHHLAVTGMTCDGCAAHVEEALRTVPGVSAAVSYEGGSAEVEAPQGVAPAQLVAAVTSAGYAAEIAGAPPTRATGGGGPGLHVAVIGSGSAAFACALRAVEEGARVSMMK